jgi:hypothetical protein
MELGDMQSNVTRDGDSVLAEEWEAKEAILLEGVA